MKHIPMDASEAMRLNAKVLRESRNGKQWRDLRKENQRRMDAVMKMRAAV